MVVGLRYIPQHNSAVQKRPNQRATRTSSLSQKRFVVLCVFISTWWDFPVGMLPCFRPKRRFVNNPELHDQLLLREQYLPGCFLQGAGWPGWSRRVISHCSSRECLQESCALDPSETDRRPHAVRTHREKFPLQWLPPMSYTAHT